MKYEGNESMSVAKQSDVRRRGLGLGMVVLCLVLAAVLMGKIPNPLDRYFEIGPGMYRTLSEVVVASKSAQLQRTIKDVLDDDGKLTLANMAGIWPVYMQAIPVGMSLPVSGAGGIDAERQRLVQLVFAHPKRTIPTLPTWPGVEHGNL